MKEILADGSNSRSSSLRNKNRQLFHKNAGSVWFTSQNQRTNYSLNELFATGPTIQDALFNIISRFRLYQYIFPANTYIQNVSTDPGEQTRHRKWHIIIWRFTEEQPLKLYQLNTVTYVTATAPYLITRYLQQLFEDEEQYHSIAAKNYQNWLLCGWCNDGLWRPISFNETI